MGVTIPSLTSTITVLLQEMEEAGERAMRSTMEVAERLAKTNHQGLSGWKNETENLETSITGYIAGDNDNLVYAHADEINILPNNSKRALAGYYKPDFDVSPPIDKTPGEITGVLHHYMTYGNRLPWATGKEDITITTLENLDVEDILRQFLVRELA
jgi:hypothetical protein